MSMYGDALNKLDDSLYIKIEPGKPVTLRLLDHPWISQKQFVDQATGESRIVTQFHWPVWDYAQQRVRVLSQGKSVFKDIANAHEVWPQGESMPSVFDVIIKRTGTGRYDTEYTVNTVPHQGTMPRIAAADMPNMEEKSKGIPLSQVLAGKTAPVLPPTVSKGAPDNQPPTQAQYAAARAEAEPEPMDTREPNPDTDDVVIQDLDSASPINLDDIPFDDGQETAP